MDEESLNISLRKFLKKVGVTAQREIENAVRRAAEDGRLEGRSTIPASVRLTLPAAGLDVKIDGEIEIE